MSWDKKERRRFVRVTAPVDVTLETSEGVIFQADAVNIGAGGFRVLIDTDLEPGSFLTVEIFLDKEEVHCRGRVVWSVKQAGDIDGETLFDIGIEFYQIEEQERLKLNCFIDSLVAKGKNNGQG